MLVKTESESLGTLLVVVINVDTYPFSYLTCYLEDTKNKCFLVALQCLIVGRPNVELVTKRLIHELVIIASIFRAMLHLKVCPYTYFRWCGYSSGPWVSFAIKVEFSMGFRKVTSRMSVSFTHLFYQVSLTR